MIVNVQLQQSLNLEWYDRLADAGIKTEDTLKNAEIHIKICTKKKMNKINE